MVMVVKWGVEVRAIPKMPAQSEDLDRSIMYLANTLACVAWFRYQ